MSTELDGHPLCSSACSHLMLHLMLHVASVATSDAACLSLINNTASIWTTNSATIMSSEGESAQSCSPWSVVLGDVFLGDGLPAAGYQSQFCFQLKLS